MGKIAFFHPDLGIGGAERLIVDAALALKNAGHSVTIFTSHHDHSHCFEETKTLLNVAVYGDWLPCSLFGRCKALFAYLRMIFLTFYFYFYHKDDYDIAICDIIPVAIIILKKITQKKCIFYCHFPDQLLTKKDSLIKKIYRLPIDYIERWGISNSDVILVNSQFTKEVFFRTFDSMNIETQVLYPTVNFSIFDKKVTGNLDIALGKNAETSFLSINRYERKKNINLAIESLKELYNANGLDESDRCKIHLIIAGGYDHLNKENIEHYLELKELARDLGLEKNVTFLKSPSDEQKQLLLHNCTAIIYTPENEHFGIVPLEAMYMRRPVIATNTGGPKETVTHGETGFLCSPNVIEFSNAMNKFVGDKSLSRELGAKGREQVVKKFNFKIFQSQLNKIVNDLLIQ